MGVCTPGEKSGDFEDERELEGQMATAYSSGTMRLGHSAQDLPHVQFAADRVAKYMAKPVAGGFSRLKRVARFFKAHPRWAVCFREQEKASKLTIRVDSDLAEDVETRKSEGFIHVLVGDYLIKSVVGTQTVPALSPGEADFCCHCRESQP